MYMMYNAQSSSNVYLAQLTDYPPLIILPFFFYPHYKSGLILHLRPSLIFLHLGASPAPQQTWEGPLMGGWLANIEIDFDDPPRPLCMISVFSPGRPY